MGNYEVVNMFALDTTMVLVEILGECNILHIV